MCECVYNMSCRRPTEEIEQGLQCSAVARHVAGLGMYALVNTGAKYFLKQKRKQKKRCANMWHVQTVLR